MNHYNKQNSKDYPEEALNYLNSRFVHYLYATASNTVISLMINEKLSHTQRLIELSQLREYRELLSTYLAIATEYAREIRYGL